MEFPAFGDAQNGTLVEEFPQPSLYHLMPAMALPYIGVLSTASVVGTFGNLLIIGTLFRTIQFDNRKNVGNVFIVNLAFSDLIVTAVINPFAVAGAVMGPSVVEGRGGQVLCSVLANLCVTSCVVSLLSVGCISINRYIFVCHHQRYTDLFTRRNCYLILMATWLIGLALDSPSHFGWSAHTFDRKTQKCLWDRAMSHHYTVFFVSVGMLLPLTVITVFYCRLFGHIKKAKNRIMKMKGSAGHTSSQAAIVKTIRQVKMIFVIFLAFSLCWCPYIIVLLSDVWDVFPLSVHLYASMIAHLHASVNFIIYGLTNKNLLDGYKSFITRHLCGRCYKLFNNFNGRAIPESVVIDEDAGFYGSVNTRHFGSGMYPSNERTSGGLTPVSGDVVNSRHDGSVSVAATDGADVEKIPTKSEVNDDELGTANDGRTVRFGMSHLANNIDNKCCADTTAGEPNVNGQCIDPNATRPVEENEKGSVEGVINTSSSISRDSHLVEDAGPQTQKLLDLN